MAFDVVPGMAQTLNKRYGEAAQCRITDSRLAWAIVLQTKADIWMITRLGRC